LSDIQIHDIFERNDTKKQYWITRIRRNHSPRGVTKFYDLDGFSFGAGLYNLTEAELLQSFTKKASYDPGNPQSTYTVTGVHSVNIKIDVGDEPKKIPVPKILESWYAQSMKYADVKPETE
jgi:hypothetical protein